MAGLIGSNIKDSAELADSIAKSLQDRYASKTPVATQESVETEVAPETTATESVETEVTETAPETEAAVTESVETQESAPAEPQVDINKVAAEAASLANAAAAQLVNEAKTEADAKVAEAERQVAELQEKLKVANSTSGVLKEMIGTEPTGVSDPEQVEEKLVGAGNPNAGRLEVIGEGSEASRQYIKLLENAPAQYVMTEMQGRILSKDTREAERYFRDNRKSVREGVQALLKDKGWFGGPSHGMTAKEAITLGADVPSIFFDYLNSFIRESHYEDLILPQFFNTSVSIGVQPGLTTQVPRYPYEPRPATIADRQLTPGTDISASSTAIIETYTPVTIEELGLQIPLGMSNFIEAYSLVQIESIVGRNLVRDYQYYKDLRARNLLFTAAVSAYNQADTVINAPATLNAGDGGKLTSAFLIRLNAEMKAAQIPAFPNGMYALVLTPNQLADLQVDRDARGRDTLQMAGSDITLDMIGRDPDRGRGFGGPVSGYKGDAYGFMIFCQNAFGVSDDTVDPLSGVTDEVTAAGNVIFESGFAFGRDTMANSIALPVEIRFDEVTDFNRRTRAIWYEHAAYAELDINEALPVTAGSTGTQFRVIRVRTARGDELA